MQAYIAVEVDLDLHNPFSSLLELLLAPRVSGICHEHKIQSRFSKRGKEKKTPNLIQIDLYGEDR